MRNPEQIRLLQQDHPFLDAFLSYSNYDRLLQDPVALSIEVEVGRIPEPEELPEQAFVLGIVKQMTENSIMHLYEITALDLGSRTDELIEYGQYDSSFEQERKSSAEIRELYRACDQASDLCKAVEETMPEEYINPIDAGSFKSFYLSLLYLGYELRSREDVKLEWPHIRKKLKAGKMLQNLVFQPTYSEVFDTKSIFAVVSAVCEAGSRLHDVHDRLQSLGQLKPFAGNSS